MSDLPNESSAQRLHFWRISVGGFFTGLSLLSLYVQYSNVGLKGVIALLHGKYETVRDFICGLPTLVGVPLPVLDEPTKDLIILVTAFMAISARTFFALRERNSLESALVGLTAGATTFMFTMLCVALLGRDNIGVWVIPLLVLGMFLLSLNWSTGPIAQRGASEFFFNVGACLVWLAFFLALNAAL